MTTKSKVWLITTKDVENLYAANGKKILFDNNYIPYEITNYVDNNELTLLDYYSDYLNENIKTIFNNNIEFRHEITTISSKIQENNPNENSILLFDKVFKLKDSDVFLTRCFPDTLNPIEGFHITDINARPVYWLIAFANTVAKILKKSIADIEFYGILHRSDIASNISNEMNSEIVSITRKRSELNLKIDRIKYSHDPNNFIYNNVLLNTSFFSNIKDNDFHNHILKSIEFPGIYERNDIIKSTKLSLEKVEVKQYFLDCEIGSIEDRTTKFKSLFFKSKLELL